MKKSSIWKLLFSALTVFAVAVFAGCTDDNDDMGAPYLNVTPENLTFDAEGQPADEYNGTFIVETNRPWRAIVEDEQTWVRLSATEGEGDAAVTVTVPASNIGQSAKVTFEVYNSYGALIQKDVNVLQGEVVPPTLIFNETAGSESVANPYPLVADYTGWNTTGEGASKVSYEGVNTSIRASGKSSAGAYDGASGPNVIFFGSAPATFTVKDITLASDQTNLKLTFGGQYYDGDNNDNNFNKDNFVVYLSANGTDYTPLSYEVNDGDQVDPYWVFATKNFTLKNATSTLYIKFEAKASLKFRLDDITLMTGNGGEEIDLAGGGVVPPDPSGDAIYENNFDKTPAAEVDGEWPFLDQTDAWQNASGTGNSTVTYTSTNVSVRTSGKLSGGYDGASGSNKIFFGSAPATFDINTITMPAGKTNYRIIFGGAYSKKNGATYDNIFKPESFHVAVGNGTDWSGNLTYEKIGGSDTTDPYWIQFAVDFTLKEAVSQLSIRFTADLASGFAIDDVQLVEGNGGQEVDLEGGVVPPDPGEVVAFSITDIKADNADLPTNGYGSQVVATPSTWVSWTVGGIEFTGVKICESPATNGSIIQMQGNDSDAAKQAKLQNVTPIDGMSKIKIVFRSYPNKSGSYYNPGYTMTVAGAAQNPVETYTDKSGYREYVHEYDLTGLGADSFELDNNKVGALYIESFEITK
ncbi:BACON domain-containing protein [Alistipes putredinis]|uniref:BACON domain-containing protein n=1 Tax=Alistipes putredinis TaxID=28117 RepID=UPI003AB56AFD